jgi:hypothetical protein
MDDDKFLSAGVINEEGKKLRKAIKFISLEAKLVLRQG